ncbi:MAG: DUF1998 domain-containing protein [Nannocystis sp.]|nr:DUF1998 domain-containing protein [Nannocystis sp.]
MSASNFGRKQVYVPPEGAIRKSQMVTTFGPGAMVDLVDQAVLIGGLDFWVFPKEHGRRVLHEPRLRDALAERFRKARLGELAVDDAFYEPPHCDERAPTRGAGVQVLEFPQWFVCQRPNCRALVRARDGLVRTSRRYQHHCDDGKKGDCVPVRFVAACKRGHLDDWPWIAFAHRGREQGTCHAPDLRLDEGATGDFSEIVVRCRTCGAWERLTSALREQTALPCSGQRPWLGVEGKQQCTERQRLLVRTATNSYFSQVESALTIPDTTRALGDAVAKVWDVLAGATPALLPAFRQIPKVADALGDWSDGDVLSAISARHEGRVLAGEPIRTAEYRQFLAAPLEAPGDRPDPSQIFFVRRLRARAGELPAGVERVVLAHKLREVRVQIGFTRIEAITADLQGEHALGEHDIGVQMANLGLTTRWLPATEIHGEGVLLALDERAVHEWEERPLVRAREQQLRVGFDEWAARFAPDVRPTFPGVRFYLLHSLSHLLITAISLECGYAASAIRERLYCASHGDPRAPMAAILLSTGTPGTEGTLGGLVDQGRFLRAHLRQAYDLGVLCSNDPVCAGHNPAQDPAERHLEGAACHGCLFIAECSCERFNNFLDRSLVVPTLGHDRALAFFAERP